MTNGENGNFSIELHRCIDDLIYKYEPAGFRNGRPCWRRIDLDLHWLERSGWVITDGEGVVPGLPWDVSRDQQEALPPDGIWVSRKGAKSYVYEHKHITGSDRD